MRLLEVLLSCILYRIRLEENILCSAVIDPRWLPTCYEILIGKAAVLLNHEYSNRVPLLRSID